MKDDIPAELECKQTALRPIVNHLKPQDPAASIVNGDQIRFKGKNYNLKTITNIPADLSTIGIKENEKHVVFSGETCPLSNLYQCEITVDNVVYPSAEHFYQSEKCKSQGRSEVALKVLEAQTSREAMLAGKSVSVSDNWYDEKGAAIMTKVIRLKVDQIEKCRDLLLAKRGKMLGASSALNKDMWTGKNRLGKIYDDILLEIPV